MKIVAVVQARMGSQRLPGKVMRQLGSKFAMEWVIDAAKRAIGVTEVVVATSVNPENDVIERACTDLFGVRCIRGSEDDVLDRYRLVIEQTKADAIVRLTADCPMLDSRVIGEVIELYKSSNCAYANNTDPATWPDGLDCEVISADVLLQAAQDATRPSDRDTVTRYIARNRSIYPSQTLICPIKGLHNERWVLDSPEDFAFLAAVVGHFPFDWVPDYLKILELLRKKPELRELNGRYSRNQRFFESVSVERHVRKDFPVSKLHFARASSLIPFASQTFSKSHLQYPPDSPLFLSHGDGAYCFDIDGNDYVDMVSALLPNVLGYCDPDVDRAIRNQLNSGISFSLATTLEADLAERLRLLIPCAEMVKFAKNGSDVTSAAVRVARGFTGRDKILMAENHYHGWHDWAVAGTSRDFGVPLKTRASNVRAKNDLDKLRKAIASEKYAAVIVEPEGKSLTWLNLLQYCCEAHGTLLIFDEVITGFRWALGGYQDHIGITPDLATFGKAMGNGMPISALVGRKDIMKRFEPPNNVFFSGTFFGEALSLAAAIATIDKLDQANVIQHLWLAGEELRDKANQKILSHDLFDVLGLRGDGPLARINFNKRLPFTENDIAGMFRKWMIESGTLVVASHNMSYAHRSNEIARVLASYDYTLGRMAEALKEAPVPGEFTVAAGGVR